MAKEGMSIWLGLTVIAFLVWGIWLFDGRWITYWAAVAGTILATFAVIFFRDPERTIPNIENALVSPADGKVVAIKSLPSHPYIQSDATQISIFLSPLDVHINRIPISGKIDFVNYKKGEFLAAYKESASEKNEQSEIGLVTSNGARIVFKQIAGVIARRIVCRLEKGQTVATGERFGMIKFGSRTDLIVPSNTLLEVKLGNRVQGGTTIIGRLSAKTISLNPSSASNQSNA
ncbi:MAG TPA: phosphatidylserine decarboxylase family protein [candidate division Zixibacteria bacterium]|nr:phosphatidylserine decarboxylase family protein [candidate division Zixibacteria bacterium]